MTDPRTTLELGDVIRAALRPLLSLRCPTCGVPCVTLDLLDVLSGVVATALIAQFELRKVEEPMDPMRKVSKRRVRKFRK